MNQSKSRVLIAFFSPILMLLLFLVYKKYLSRTDTEMKTITRPVYFNKIN